MVTLLFKLLGLCHGKIWKWQKTALLQDRMFSHPSSAPFHLHLTRLYTLCDDVHVPRPDVTAPVHFSVCPSPLVIPCGPPKRGITLGKAAPFQQGQFLGGSRTPSASALKGRLGGTRACTSAVACVCSDAWQHQHHLGDSSSRAQNCVIRNSGGAQPSVWTSPPGGSDALRFENHCIIKL